MIPAEYSRYGGARTEGNFVEFDISDPVNATIRITHAKPSPAPSVHKSAISIYYNVAFDQLSRESIDNRTAKLVLQSGRRSEDISASELDTIRRSVEKAAYQAAHAIFEDHTKAILERMGATYGSLKTPPSLERGLMGYGNLKFDDETKKPKISMLSFKTAREHVDAMFESKMIEEKQHDSAIKLIKGFDDPKQITHSGGRC